MSGDSPGEKMSSHLMLKRAVTMAAFMVDVAVFVSGTVFQGCPLILRGISPCEFKSKIGNWTVVPSQRRTNLVLTLKYKLSLITAFLFSPRLFS